MPLSTQIMDVETKWKSSLW